MYLDEVFNNFLGTLRHVPDIRIDNPNLEQGKFVNDRTRYYAGKVVPTMITTESGECKVSTVSMQKPDLELIERSSGPEYGTVMEGFKQGSTVEGLTGGGSGRGGSGSGYTSSGSTASQADFVNYDNLYKSFTAKSTEYNSALKTYNAFIHSYSYANYFDKYVRLQTKAASTATGSTPGTPAEYDTYYINKYGFRYKIPTSTPTNLIPTFPDSTDSIPIISASDFAGFPIQTMTNYTVSANQRLNLAGTIVKYAAATSAATSTSTSSSSSSSSSSSQTASTSAVYVWVDIEGIAHVFDSTVLSDNVNNCKSTCWAKKSAMSSDSISGFASRDLFITAIGGEKMIGTSITKANNISCIELPSSIIAMKAVIDGIETELKASADKLGITQGTQTPNSHTQEEAVNAVGDAVQQPTPQLNSGLMSEYHSIQKDMSTFDGKVDDSGLNVKSKLGYYVLWLSLMIFIVVVTFRNIANSDSTESGSFMISVALLIILLIYLFNYLSKFRLGPQQMISKAAGDLPEKVSGMMKFTFT